MWAALDPVIVQSGVPQGTVLGPLMFLLYINDIADGLSSPLRLFADDCLLYRTINSEEDAIQLQNDLDQLSTWANKWQLRFNVIMVLPKMEYAATVWDPYYQNDIQHLEKVQCRAARWVLNDFSRYSSVTDICYSNFPGQLSKYVVGYVDYKHYLKSSTMNALCLFHHNT